jgi:hypothetical protein
MFADKTAVVTCGSLKEDIGASEAKFLHEDDEARFNM